MEKTIYMPLLGEGTECWRPVKATQIAEDVFEIVEEVPEGESWKFAAFSRVRCKDKVFADGQPGLVIFAYAVESHPCYRLLKGHLQEVVRITLADGEEAVVRVMHVDEEHEDFVCEIISTNLERKYVGMPKEAAYAVKFTDLVSVRLEK